MVNIYKSFVGSYLQNLQKVNGNIPSPSLNSEERRKGDQLSVIFQMSEGSDLVIVQVWQQRTFFAHKDKAFHLLSAAGPAIQRC